MTNILQFDLGEVDFSLILKQFFIIKSKVEDTILFSVKLYGKFMGNSESGPLESSLGFFVQKLSKNSNQT